MCSILHVVATVVSVGLVGRALDSSGAGVSYLVFWDGVNQLLILGFLCFGGPTMARGVFGAGSGLARVWWCAGERVWFLFFGGFLLVLAGGWALGCRSIGLGHFRDIS